MTATLGYENISVEDYKNRLHDTGIPHLLLDVRTTEEFHDYHIPGAVNIPLDELPDRMAEIANMAEDKPVVMVCKSGVRSIMGAQMLRYAGLKDIDLLNLETGTKGWADKHYPLEP